MSQLGTILYKSQLHNIVPAANEVVTMAEARTGQAVGPIRQEQISAKDGNKFMQTNGTTTQSLAPISIFDIRQIITYKQCSSFIEMSRSSHLEMSCSALGMLAGSPRDYGAGHASSDTGDIEHARTRPTE
ncbi:MULTISPECIES: hypothetical protein, partial [Paraburkholderia]|uniref:hypothetical protein n=1 Tax=Paraburkholderia TaxID=1822464 RepID=UPI003218BEFD